ncbi:hypothetical protein FOA52_012795 [Chlamydomonas sp. UWO 241]|nr:hypothetical protein FOA52_012795 [Chlamydomonas sp. UWO 241]
MTPPKLCLALAATLLLLLCVSVNAGEDTETIRPAARKLSTPGGSRSLTQRADGNDVFVKGIPSKLLGDVDFMNLNNMTQTKATFIRDVAPLKPLCGDEPFSGKCCNTDDKDSNCDGTAKIDEGLLEKLITGRILEALEIKTVKPWIVFPWFPWGLTFHNVGTEWSKDQTLCVGVKKAPVDVMFLADTTGSMGGIIGAVNTAANSVMGSLLTSIPNLQVGIGAYRDTSDAYMYKRFQPIQYMNAGTFSTNVGSAWSASGGGDWPEANLFALQQVATGTGASVSSNWRPGSIKIVVWFGDAPGHDPSGSATLASVTAAMASQGIKVIALDASQLNYPSPTPQASSLAASTGGYYGPVSSGTVATTIINTIANSVAVVIKPVVTCPLNSPFIIEVEPEVCTATPLKPCCFRIRVKLCEAGDCTPAGGPYACTIKFVDQATPPNVIDARPIIIYTAGTGDTSPPYFTALPPVSTTLECPATPWCPTLLAEDNCDNPVKVTPTPSSMICAKNGKPSCCEKTTCLWSHSDSAGNSVTASTEIVIQDTTPPAFSPPCANGAICMHPAFPGASPPVSEFSCLNLASLTKKCFRDACNEVARYSVKCTGCVDTSNPDVPVTTSCDKHMQNDRMCFGSGDRAQCCHLEIKVEDTCNNIATYPMTVCWDPKSLPKTTPDGTPCLPESPFV